MKELHRDDFEDLAAFAKTIPNMISRFIEEQNITADRNQITMIQQLFLGFYSNDSCIFRRGDAVLMLEIAKLVRSNLERIEFNAQGEHLFFFDGDHAAERSKTAITPVRELFASDGMNFEVNETIIEESIGNDGKFAIYLFINHL